MVSVSVQGIGRLQSKLDELVRTSDTELVKAMNQAAGVVDGDAKSLAPVDTSILRGSIHPIKAQVSGKSVQSGVATSLEYAKYVEFGTGTRGGSEGATKLGITFGSKPGQVAQPFLYPALQSNKEKINSLIAKAVIVAARKVKK